MGADEDHSAEVAALKKQIAAMEAAQGGRIAALLSLFPAGFLYFATGSGLFVALLLKPFDNHSLVFLAAIVSIALVFYGTGSQSTLSFDRQSAANAHLNLWIGGGAAVLALVFGQFIIWNEVSIRSVFRMNAVPVVLDVEYCLLGDESCFGGAPRSGEKAATVELDQTEFAAVANSVAVWGDTDKSYFQDVSVGEHIRRRYLVFTERRAEFRIERDISAKYQIADALALDLPNKKPITGASATGQGCLQKAIVGTQVCALFHASTEPSHLVEGLHRLKVAIVPKALAATDKKTFVATTPTDGKAVDVKNRVDFTVE